MKIHVMGQILIMFVVTGLVFGIGQYAYYNDNIYPVTQISSYLSNAKSTTNVFDKSGFLAISFKDLQPYTGNPTWIFPLPYTDFENIKLTLGQTIATSIVLSQRVDVEAMSYQQSLLALDNTITELQKRIHTTAHNWHGNPTLNPFAMWSYLFIVLSLFVMLTIIDYNRNKWYI